MYSAKEFNSISIPALKQEQIDLHLTLYKGYVTNFNILCEDIGKAESVKVKSEMYRRVGFEWNGIRSHEIYFESVSGASPLSGGALQEKIEKIYGSFDVLKETITTLALTARGPGWVFFGYDAVRDICILSWIADHELGVPVGITPLVMIDVWEHAYLYKGDVSEKKEYVSSYVDSINWSVVEQRFSQSLQKI